MYLMIYKYNMFKFKLNIDLRRLATPGKFPTIFTRETAILFFDTKPLLESGPI